MNRPNEVKRTVRLKVTIKQETTMTVRSVKRLGVAVVLSINGRFVDGDRRGNDGNSVRRYILPEDVSRVAETGSLVCRNGKLSDHSGPTAAEPLVLYGEDNQFKRCSTMLGYDK